MPTPLGYWKRQKLAFEDAVKHNKNKKKPGSKFLGFRLPSGIEVAIEGVQKVVYTGKGAAELKKCRAAYNTAMKKWEVAKNKYKAELRNAEHNPDFDKEYQGAVKLLRRALKATEELLTEWPHDHWAAYFEKSTQWNDD